MTKENEISPVESKLAFIHYVFEKARRIKGNKTQEFILLINIFALYPYIFPEYRESIENIYNGVRRLFEKK